MAPAPEPYDQERIDRIDDSDGFRYCSAEELRTFLDPAPDWRVADLGSGTGLFTDELAPVVRTVFAVDVRRGMHEAYREKGPADGVVPVVADFESLPFPDGALDAAVSMRTYHHGFETALSEVARVLRPGGRLVVVDWSATGAMDREIHEIEEYHDLATVQSDLLDAGFRIADARERRETLVVIGAKR